MGIPDKKEGPEGPSIGNVLCARRGTQRAGSTRPSASGKPPCAGMRTADGGASCTCGARRPYGADKPDGERTGPDDDDDSDDDDGGARSPIRREHRLALLHPATARGSEGPRPRCKDRKTLVHSCLSPCFTILMISFYYRWTFLCSCRSRKGHLIDPPGGPTCLIRLRISLYTSR